MEFNSLDAQGEACEAYITASAGKVGSRSPTATTMEACPAAHSTALPSNAS